MSTRNDDPERASRPFDAEPGRLRARRGRRRAWCWSGATTRRPGARGSTARSPASAPARRATTSPRPSRRATARSAAVSAALRSAGLSAADIGHVNSHATSTPVGDSAEAETIRKAIGDHADPDRAQGSIGHMLGASGAVEAIATPAVRPRRHRPGDREPGEPGPGRRAGRGRRGEPRKVELTAAVNDSFGFGGHNVALVFTGLSRLATRQQRKVPRLRLGHFAHLVFGRRALLCRRRSSAALSAFTSGSTDSSSCRCTREVRRLPRLGAGERDQHAQRLPGAALIR